MNEVEWKNKDYSDVDIDVLDRMLQDSMNRILESSNKIRSYRKEVSQYKFLTDEWKEVVLKEYKNEHDNLVSYHNFLLNLHSEKSFN